MKTEEKTLFLKKQCCKYGSLNFDASQKHKQSLLVCLELYNVGKNSSVAWQKVIITEKLMLTGHKFL